MFYLRQHCTIPALRLKHRSGGCGTASAFPKCSIMSDCVTRIVLRGQKPDLVMNIALPYQDLTIMDACLACGVNYMDTANYEPENTDRAGQCS